MPLDSTELQFLEISKRVIAISVQAANAYAAEQAKLEPERILSPQRLTSAAGTLASLADIDQLAALTAAHKQLCEQIITASSAEYASVINTLPAAERQARTTEHADRLTWLLHSQSAFYAAREQWLDAARNICALMQSCRDTAVFSDTVQFANDDEYDRFEAEMARIEAAHQEEVRIMNDKAGRMQAAMAGLGLLRQGN